MIDAAAFSLRSARLAGRPFRRADWPLVHALQSHPQTGPWLRGPHIPASEERSKDIAERFAESWAADGFGPYLWRMGLRDVGYAGLRRSRLDGDDALEVLWAILPEHQGKGLATEAAAAAVDADADGHPLTGWALRDNAASIRVMRKLGFAFAGEMSWANLPHVVYRRPAA